jgi:hypothetical protein
MTKAVTPPDGGEYLICKYGMYYRPNAQGYTGSVAEAGRYTLAEAIRHSHPNGPDGPRDGMSYRAVTPDDAPWYCSFCTKSQNDVKKLIVGDRTTGICDECVGLCVDILVAEGFPDALRDHRPRVMLAGDVGVDARLII